MKRLRRYLVAGLLVWIPIVVTIFVVRIIVNLMEWSLFLLPQRYRPEELLGFAIPGLGILLSLILLVGTGMLAANIVGSTAVKMWESMLNRIPFVRSIYSASKRFAEMVFSDTGTSFKKVLLIQYPRRGLYTLCFLSATRMGEVQGRTGEDVVCAFVPTTPNPTSGFLVMVPRREVIELDMEIEEAFKLIFSLGVVVPTWRSEELPDLPLAVPPRGEAESEAEERASRGEKA